VAIRDHFKAVYYDPSLEGLPWGRREIERFLPFNPRPKGREELKEEILSLSPDPIGDGKRVLYLAPHRGSLLKPCPGTKGYSCCGYWVGNVAVGCPMDCTYCILQGYLNEPIITLQLPWGKFFDELRAKARGPRPLRVGTGELSDSLVLEPFLGFVAEAVEFFARFEGAVLELKTKTDRVEGLLPLEHASRTVVAWSLNPPKVVEEQERGTAALMARLKAARLCQQRGYPVAFHFDPLLHYSGWESDYQMLIEELFRWIDPRGVIWISLGTLRFPKGLEKIIRQRFPRSWILSGEFLPGEDGKLRYFKPLRIEIYKKVLSWLREYPLKGFIYLCMEREDVWEAVFGFRPGGTRGLKERLESHTEEFLRKW